MSFRLISPLLFGGFLALAVLATSANASDPVPGIDVVLGNPHGAGRVKPPRTSAQKQTVAPGAPNQKREAINTSRSNIKHNR
jgi:hypothetical protein